MTNERKFILDANVIISALLFGGSQPYKAFIKARENGLLIFSEAIFTEIKTVLSRPKFDRYLSSITKDELINNLAKTSVFIEPFI
jgi:putative PIN family toxin of toxin-antitoxin system